MRQHPSRQLRGRRPQEGSDQPRRREDQRRGDREPDPARTRRCRTSPASPMPDPDLGERMCACVILQPGKHARRSPSWSTFLKRQGDRQIQAARAARGRCDDFPVSTFGKVSKKTLEWSPKHGARRRARTPCASLTCTAIPARETGSAARGRMSRRSPSTGSASGPGKHEDEVVKEFTDAGVEAVLVALDLETTIETPPCSNEYVHAMWTAPSRAHHPELGRGRSVQGRGRDRSRRGSDRPSSACSASTSIRSWSTSRSTTGALPAVRGDQRAEARR